MSHTPPSSGDQPGPRQPASAESAEAARRRELDTEQQVVDLAYAELDRQLDRARRSLAETEAQEVSGTHQSRGERDAYAVHYSGLVSSLEGVESRLVFGRMDMTAQAAQAAGGSSPVTRGGARHYIGRTGLQDSAHREVVLDWRAPLARAFYQATARDPMGLVRRRHIDTRDRTVVGVEDELIDVTALGGKDGHQDDGGSGRRTHDLQEEDLQGEGALIAAMSAARDGRMGDIVATIQAEQDRVVTSGGRGVLVVQGGPGTGKTAVALHRVAYLFYSERERLERSGVLLVGPSPTFLRYVEQVLPSLGETGVVSTTMSDLLPGVRARGTEPAQAAEIKGRSAWVEILRRAVRSLQRVPDGPRTIRVEGTSLVLEPSQVREAATRARRSGKPHNQAREPFVLWLLERLTDQYAAATGQDVSDPDTRAWIREDIRTARDARREINLCWMPTTPTGLLERLWTRPQLLETLAPELTATERGLLRRPAGSALTAADVPLLDELAELLGPSEDAQAHQARLEAQRHEQLVAYAAQAIESQELGNGMVSAQMLAQRVQGTGPSLTLAERARADRSWTYGHVVVDEAQELGAMAWRALARRCPVRSFTVVGDLAQYSGPHAPASWQEALAGLGTSAGGSPPRGSRGHSGKKTSGSAPLRQEVLSVCYRTPATIMAAAEAVVGALGHPTPYPVRSVRDLPDCLHVDDLSGTRSAQDDQAWAQVLRSAVSEERDLLDSWAGPGGGRLAVITAEADQETDQVVQALAQDPALAQAMEAPGGDVLRARVAVMAAAAAKGLEFDVVVLLDPDRLAAASPGDLYVAMTRPTRRLRVLCRSTPPQGLDGRHR
ncbi:DUF2075 domain-containing protein [Actinomyces sp. 2119]|uniref:HelD family protein n=1 Tax=Actinomyces sp. 2119 TaxID=2321393 RepID=UPI000E6CDC6E|nr:DNA/RNA helicase domain-containing protein [Actinomyces sp. 2119]RJF43050.1 DUF2075 domain-containing protein [Actinomyces sp. 2119]